MTDTDFAELEAEIGRAVAEHRALKNELDRLIREKGALLIGHKRLKALTAYLLAALKEMHDAHSFENVGLNASQRRIAATRQARAAIAKVEE